MQNSYYKKIHEDIPQVVSEIAKGLDWTPLAYRDFQVRTKATANGGTRNWRKAAIATEAVLAFSR